MNLTNNSKEMKTVVETFVIEETAELIYDNEKLDKWNDLVSELGLQGQTTIVKPSKSPIPFMHIKESLKNVFETLCPRKVKVENYNLTPIPVEILELIMLSKREKYFNEVQIWYDEKSPDPICLGVTNNFFLHHYKSVPKKAESKNYPTKQDALDEILKHDPTFDSNQSFGWEADHTYYLLGKWADVKHSFDELKEMATKRYIGQKENDLQKEILEAKRKLEDLKSDAFNLFN